MNYKLIVFFLFLTSCVPEDLSENYKKEIIFLEVFSNRGFALTFDKSLKKQKIISKSIDDRALIVFQRNLVPDTLVKITNLENNKSIIAKVGPKVKYPAFYNVVISRRISNEIDLDTKEPYVEIKSIDQNSTFVAKKAKIFEEEKKVADKAPVDEITIKAIGSHSNSDNKEKKDITKKDFKYIIKVADFYFINSAKLLKKKILDELKVKNAYIRKLSKTSFRVYLGPYDNLESLKNGFDDINKLEFENIEFLKL